MSNLIYLDLPKNLSDREKEKILEEVRDIGGVEESDFDEERFIDAASITAYIALATSAIVLVDKAVPIVQKLMDIFKKRGLKNVNITLPDDTKIILEDGNVNDVEKLARALTKIANK
jgi:hypothetical protein